MNRTKFCTIFKDKYAAEVEKKGGVFYTFDVNYNSPTPGSLPCTLRVLSLAESPLAEGRRLACASIQSSVPFSCVIHNGYDKST